MTEQAYVVGLAFDERREALVLQRKRRPTWQAGRLNGPGGKIEAGEQAVDAMRREFREETGVDVGVPRWRSFCVTRGPGWVVYYFKATLSDGELCKALKFAPEPSDLSSREYLLLEPAILGKLDHPALIPSLRWAIPMALDDDLDVVRVSDRTVDGQRLETSW